MNKKKTEEKNIFLETKKTKKLKEKTEIPMIVEIPRIDFNKGDKR